MHDIAEMVRQPQAATAVMGRYLVSCVSPKGRATLARGRRGGLINALSRRSILKTGKAFREQASLRLQRRCSADPGEVASQPRLWWIAAVATGTARLLEKGCQAVFDGRIAEQQCRETAAHRATAPQAVVGIYMQLLQRALRQLIHDGGIFQKLPVQLPRGVVLDRAASLARWAPPTRVSNDNQLSARVPHFTSDGPKDEAELQRYARHRRFTTRPCALRIPGGRQGVALAKRWSRWKMAAVSRLAEWR